MGIQYECSTNLLQITSAFNYYSLFAKRCLDLALAAIIIIIIFMLMFQVKMLHNKAFNSTRAHLMPTKGMVRHTQGRVSVSYERLAGCLLYPNI